MLRSSISSRSSNDSRELRDTSRREPLPRVRLRPPLWVVAALSALTIGVGACGSIPRPRALEQAAEAERSAQVRAARDIAPQAYAQAENLRQRAEDAYSKQDLAAAEILAEQAIVAYRRATLLSRRTRAESLHAEAEREVEKAKVELASLAEQEQRLAAEAQALELKVKVATDAIPLSPIGPASEARERARREAARAIAVEARLLCLSAELIQASRPGVQAALVELEQIPPQLKNAKIPAPLDSVTRLRSACLNELTLARRPATLKNPVQGQADALLSELSRGGFLPFRDDRGVVITLRGAFDERAEPNAALKQRLDEVVRVARAHSDFPLLIVVHSAAEGAEARDRERALTLADLLRKGGVSCSVQAQAAGNAQPILPGTRPGALERNQRIEVVFVARSSS